MEGETIMLYRKWIDFAVYPADADRANSRDERLKTDNAVSESENDGDPGKRFGLIVSRNDYGFRDDIFEAMRFDDDGNVIIWTAKRVRSLHRRIDGKGKLTFLPRNPDLNRLF